MILLLRLLRGIILTAGFCALLWLGGLLVFAQHISNLDAAVTDPDPAPVDAIVVLTGGSERVSTGIDLLVAGKGKKLFISGVYPGLTLEHILSTQKVPENLRACCIVLGHAAETTHGNAEETQDWLSLENFHSLRLVTANYHMPRSLLLFHALLSDITIIPHPIAPDSVKLDAWWRHNGTASLLVSEYNKYLFAALGLWVGAL